MDICKQCKEGDNISHRVLTDTNSDRNKNKKFNARRISESNIIKEESSDYCILVGEKRISGRVSYRKVRNILRHTGQVKGRQTLTISGAGNTDFVYFVNPDTMRTIFSLLEKDNANLFMKLRIR